MKNIKISFLTPLVIALFTFGHPVKLTAQNELYPSKKLKPEKNLSHENLYESQFLVVNRVCLKTLKPTPDKGKRLKLG